MHGSWYRFVSKQNRDNVTLSKNTSTTNSISSEHKEEEQEVSRIEAKEVVGRLGPNHNLNDILRRRSDSPAAKTNLKVSNTSIDVIIPNQEYDPSLDILRSFSSDSMRGINKSKSADPDFDRGLVRPSTTVPLAVEPAPIPRRNLTKAFEEMYIEPSKSWASGSSDSPKTKPSNNAVGKASSSAVSNIISPTGVTELEPAAMASPVARTLSTSDTTDLITPVRADKDSTTDEHNEDQYLNEPFRFRLHPQLQRDMTDALVERVCFYSIIHDINKEATLMASHDDSGYNRNPDIMNEKFDPIVVAINGRPSQRVEFSGASSIITTALIDEEEWLLDAINSRNSEEARSIKACPPTFLQAMGERDYENPLTSLSNGSRTQLWKPSRSWWEAKSGKNPWIEPTSHNKRWRYLWPLIHYHKFLAKCIKKLKRNSICVKTSVSPVAVFLREEVCAVSDHLASVSLFDSDEWMFCLKHFEGWVESNQEAAENCRKLVSKLKLRPLHDPGDIDSALLRNQIDEHLLRAIVNARAQLTGTENEKDEKRGTKDSLRRRERNQTDSVKSSVSISSVDAEAPRPRHVSGLNSKGRPSGPRHWQAYSHHGWWQNNWQHHHPYPYGDDGSVHSALSCDTTFSHGYINNFNNGPVPNHGQYYPPMMYTQHHALHGGLHGQYPSSVVPPNPSMYPGDPYDPQQIDHANWMRTSSLSQFQNHASVPVPETRPKNDESQDSSISVDNDRADLPESSQNPDESFDTHQTPYKPNPNHVPMSPYWGHLQDHATLTMMGLSSPPASVPPTPHRNADASFHQEDGTGEMKNNINAQPLLLRQQYYGYGYGSREGYAPPSPATQFMMSPQASFAYNYGYGFSPSRRSSSQTKLLNTSISEEEIDALHGLPETGNTVPKPTSPSLRGNNDHGKKVEKEPTK